MQELEPKIVVLDAFRINPGDLSWDALINLGKVTLFDRTSPTEIVDHIGDATIVLTNKAVIDRAAIEQLKSVKYIGILATGTNVVDVKAAQDKGIIVTNVPAYSTMSVAQAAISLLLAITGRVEHYTEEIRHGEWSIKPDFCYWNHDITELDGKTIGIVGFGHIGQAVARIAASLGMKPLIFTSRPADQLPAGMRKAESLNLIFTESDVISLHCPLADDTFHLVNSERLALMKKTAIIINTARGALIDEQALADALNSRRIYAAGLDVLEQEPPQPTNPLLTARNCFLTPHIGWASREARYRLIAIAVANVANFLAGHPTNIVQE